MVSHSKLNDDRAGGLEVYLVRITHANADFLKIKGRIPVCSVH